MAFLNHAKTAFLLGSLIGLCMLIGYLIGGGQGMLIGLIFGGVGNIISFWFSDKIAIAAMQGQPVSRDEAPWLHEMIERLAQRAGLPKPRIYVCPQDAPNAFATGRGPKNAAVAITAGMLRHFPKEEIEGVMAHELGHIRNRDVLISTIAAVLAGMISYAAYMMMWFGGGQRNESPVGAVGAILAIVLAPIAATIIQLAISRQREYAADAFAGEVTGDPMLLANALQRLQHGNERIPMDTNPAFNAMFIMEPLSGGGVMALFATHPPAEKRIAALVRQAEKMGHGLRSGRNVRVY
jgi:heat shock protein HtpX